MKFLPLLILSFASSTLFADEDESSSTTTSEKVIVINKPSRRKHDGPKVIVESGTDKISGTPEEQLKAAYRTWEQACRDWKAELKSLNSSNLLFASCGEPKRGEELIQSQKIYTYRSDARYKIKVVGQ